MSSAMDTNMTSLDAVHQKAVDLLTRKLAVLPKHNFNGGRKPDINDYYQLQEVCFPDHIPKDVSLPFVFGNFNQIAARGFSGGKFEGGLDIARAIWYWRMDKRHSFSRHHGQVLANLILAAIIVAEDTEPDKQLVWFLQTFVLAFISHNSRDDGCEPEELFLRLWWDGPWDLIKFSNSCLMMIMEKIKDVKKDLPKDVPFHWSDFIKEAYKQDRVVYCEHVVTWAIYWYVNLEPVFQTIDQAEKKYNETAVITPDTLCASLAGVGMNREYPPYLNLDHFNKPEMEALLKDIDNDVQPPPGIPSRMWMEPGAAAKRLLNSNLSGALQKLSI